MCLEKTLEKKTLSQNHSSWEVTFRAGEMLSGEEWLLHKHEDRSLSPQHSCKKMGDTNTCKVLTLWGWGQDNV